MKRYIAFLLSETQADRPAAWVGQMGRQVYVLDASGSPDPTKRHGSVIYAWQDAYAMPSAPEMFDTIEKAAAKYPDIAWGEIPEGPKMLETLIPNALHTAEIVKSFTAQPGDMVTIETQDMVGVWSLTFQRNGGFPMTSMIAGSTRVATKLDGGSYVLTMKPIEGIGGPATFGAVLQGAGA